MKNHLEMGKLIPMLKELGNYQSDCIVHSKIHSRLWKTELELIFDLINIWATLTLVIEIEYLVFKKRGCDYRWAP